MQVSDFAKKLGRLHLLGFLIQLMLLVVDTSGIKFGLMDHRLMKASAILKHTMRMKLRKLVTIRYMGFWGMKQLLRLLRLPSWIMCLIQGIKLKNRENQEFLVWTVSWRESIRMPRLRFLRLDLLRTLTAMAVKIIQLFLQRLKAVSMLVLLTCGSAISNWFAASEMFGSTVLINRRLSR